jgi:hypothetical protein
MHICIHLYVIRDICKSLLIIKVNQWNRRTVRKYDVGRNGKTIIKRLYICYCFGLAINVWAFIQFWIALEFLFLLIILIIFLSQLQKSVCCVLTEIKVATSSKFWVPNQNQTKFSKCNPNLTKPNTKNLDPNQIKLRFFDTTQTQNQTLKYFKV